MFELTAKMIADYANALEKAAPSIRSHKMSTEKFWRPHIVEAAIESLYEEMCAAVGLCKKDPERK